ncbi:MAG: hypothetical protein IJN76_01045 [Clostridia bacterium]|nr:hypothetical protein [Clostridia bacterium]
MRFFNACAEVAQQVKNEMSQEDRLRFMDTPYEEVWQYHFSVGMWIRNRYLGKTEYLYKALLVLGNKTEDEMSLYLLKFIWQYLRLERACML